MIKKIFLLGNPNVGKSVVFSRLTGVQVISSNYPGTTVEILRGQLKIRDESIEVVDLPGTYSLEPSSKAEEVAVSILGESPKEEVAIINIIDSTNLERNLFLTLQLIENGYSVIACLNMCDDTTHRGITLDIKKLEEILQIPVISTCAVTGVGIKFLIERIKEAHPAVRNRLSHEERWKEIGRIIESVQQLSHRHHTFRELLEDASIRPLSGLLISAVVMYASFKIVRFLGEFMISNICDPVFFDLYQPLVMRLSNVLGGDGFWHHLLIGDLINGKIDFKQSFGVLTTAPYIEFAMVLPYIASFYFILSLLEDIGYLPRLAILLDNLLHRLGLHGFAIIPILLGFGCNVPGILATRVLESKRERFIASTLISIGVPCVPLQAMIFGLLGGFGGWYVGGVYLVLFSLILTLGIIMNRTLKGYSPEFLLEIPPYRFPPLHILAAKLYFRIKGFIFEAVPIVLLGVFLINILMYAKIFDLVTGLFAPVIKNLFGLPKEAIVALIIGFLRKDVAVGLLMPLGLTAKQLFISATLLAISFPCVATFVIMLKELGLRYLIKAVIIMISVTLVVGTILNFGILR
ncbi:MAG: ferrous iron transporter B [Candidatus Omnitrophica bacterium]|jgi:ferrous iron transport protein B|nr:ferrous iron transporter B [Candidatus Omnitrophota bacterium]